MDAPAIDEALRNKLELVASSFSRMTGRPLLDAVTPQSFWSAPRVIVAHGTEADPVFFYGNCMALEVFEMDFTRFTQFPSRYSAEPVNRKERASLLERVSLNGFIDDYSGVRISAKDRHFRIEQAVVWNLPDAGGAIHGQAATFAHWVDL